MEIKQCSNVRDPSTLPKFQYQRDLHQFALKTLSYDKLMEQYLYRNEEEEAKNEFSELTARTKKR